MTEICCSPKILRARILVIMYGLVRVWAGDRVGNVRQFGPSIGVFLLTVQRGASFLDRLCKFCLVFVVLSRLFVAAL